MSGGQCQFPDHRDPFLPQLLQNREIMGHAGADQDKIGASQKIKTMAALLVADAKPPPPGRSWKAGNWARRAG